MRRLDDLPEGEKINEPAFKQLIRAAVAANFAARNGQPRRSKPGSQEYHEERILPTSAIPPGIVHVLGYLRGTCDRLCYQAQELSSGAAVS